MRQMLVAVVAAASATMLTVAPVLAQDSGIISCPDTVITGRISSGETFEAPFGPGLVFRLDSEVSPKNPQGWTIRVTPAAQTEADYSMVATPPYRFSNPRYLDTSYGVTAEVAFLWTPRQFRYVATQADYEVANEALGVLLWPGEYSEVEIADAKAAISEVPTRPGTVWIEDGAITQPSPENPGGELAWIRFRAQLCSAAEDSSHQGTGK